MQQIIYFFIRNKNSVVFAVLFAVSILLTIQTHNFHNHKSISSANAMTGSIFKFKNNLTDYLSLGTANEKLLEENLLLRRQLETSSELFPVPDFDTTSMPKFEYLSATVINNNYSKTKNQITINKGRNDRVKTDMGVVSTQGLVGIISDISKNY